MKSTGTVLLISSNKETPRTKQMHGLVWSATIYCRFDSGDLSPDFQAINCLIQSGIEMPHSINKWGQSKK